MTITFNWFSFLLDSEILKYSVSSFRRQYPDAVLIIWEEAARPISAEARTYCEKLGAAVKRTTFPRNGNLKGLAAMGGILECLEAATTDYTFKVDSDTIRRQGTRLDQYFNKDAVFLTHEGRGFGFFYGFKTSAISELKKRPWPELMEFSPKFPEDVMIYKLSKNAGMDIAEVLFSSRIWIGWRTGTTLEDLQGVDIATIGQRTADMSRSDARALSAATAQQIEPLLEV